MIIRRRNQKRGVQLTDFGVGSVWSCLSAFCSVGPYIGGCISINFHTLLRISLLTFLFFWFLFLTNQHRSRKIVQTSEKRHKFSKTSKYKSAIKTKCEKKWTKSHITNTRVHSHQLVKRCAKGKDNRLKIAKHHGKVRQVRIANKKTKWNKIKKTICRIFSDRNTSLRL